VFLVIFGAGASHDSVPTASRIHDLNHPLCPPLANDLFHPRRPAFVEAAYDWHEGAGLIGEIRGRVASGAGVETALEHFVAEADAGHPETIRGLVAIRYYIVQVIRRCSAAWSRDHGNVTNYRILFNQLERWRAGHDDKALLVTFNYDGLLEGALRSSGRRLDDIDLYISRDDFRLIKPHGSMSWLRGVAGNASWDEHAIIEAAPTLDLVSGTITQGPPPGFANSVPAIAIPTQTKTTFECPPLHIEALEEWLPDVDRILVIGWRAQERDFLDLLEKHVANQNGVEGLIVSGSRQGAEATVLALQKVLPKACLHPSAAAGFSPFVDSDNPITVWLERRLHTRLDRDDPDHRTVNLLE
jgi:hypothetical protein